MYVIKNAIKSITRTKSRNILIGIIVVIIGVACTISLSIKNSAQSLISSYQEEFEIEATLGLNRQNMRQDYKKGTKQDESGNALTTAEDLLSTVSDITVEDVENYASSEYVKSYLFNVETGLNATEDGISKVSSEVERMENKNNTNSSTNDGLSMPGNFSPNQNGKMNFKSSSSDFSIVGYNSLDAMSDFISGTYKISSGAVFEISSSDNSCIISEELAEENSLEVGSNFTLVNPENESETYTFVISGIYADNSESEEFSMFSQSANKIIVSYNSLKNIVDNSGILSEDEKLSMTTDATFILISSDVVEAFETEIKSKGLNEYYSVSTNLSDLEEEISPIKNLDVFASAMLYIVLAVGGVILMIVNMINIRERKYEIGVLRAIGMKKGKVLLQFICEIFIVTIISILIGTVIGGIFSVPVANKMLENEIQETSNSQEEISSNFGMQKQDMNKGGISMPSDKNIKNIFSGNSNVEYVDKINAIIDIRTVLEIIIVGIILTLFGSVVSMVAIARYKPLKILSNRT